MRQVYRLEEVDLIVQKILTFAEHKIFLFEGPMVVGKTTLINSFCSHWNVIDTVSSPTFSLVNEYKNEFDESIFHFDCYRLDSEEEAFDFGAEEYLDSGSICLIEWPDKIQSLLPEKVHSIQLEYIDQNTRKIQFI